MTSRQQILEEWYREQAAYFFTTEAHRVAGLLGVSVRKVAIGTYRTQWGSCSAKGRLAFNARLIFAPRWVAEYVVVHEVVHLVHHNHSKQYWAVVGKLYPNYKEARRWLRHNARNLLVPRTFIPLAHS